MLPISLVAIVHNASGRVKPLVERHRDVVSEVIIVDQGSTDGTYEEALACADKVYQRRCKGTADPDRNWAFNLASQPYVLYLDDDEYLPAETKKMLPDILNEDADIYWFKRDNFVDGVNIHEVMGEDKQCRLFKVGAVRFPDKIHTYPVGAMDTRVVYLDYSIRHERTLSGLKAANKAREVIADEKAIAMQNDFIRMVEKALKDSEGFSEDWYSSQQLGELRKAYGLVKGLKGDVIEIGCWEGKSTCTLANEAFPDVVNAVDTWAGNIVEGEDHPSVMKAKQVDVHQTFLSNVAKRTKGNVKDHKQDCFDFLNKHEGQVKFCHIDAAHDYASVKRTIDMLKPRLVKGAVLCGDDFKSANLKREDLAGGVEKAVRECCPGFKAVDNFWYWVNK